MAQVYGYQLDSILPLPVPVPMQAHYLTGRISKWQGPVTYGRGWAWIDADGSNPQGAYWRDIENGDGTPADFPGWLDRRHAAGLGWGGGYCNRATLPTMIREAGDRPWSLWLATLDGTIPSPLELELPPHVTLVMVQFARAQVNGVAVDISAVLDPAYWARAL